MAYYFRYDYNNSLINYVLQKYQGDSCRIKLIKAGMQKRLIAISCYAVFWLAFFFTARLLFIFMQYHSSFQNSFGDLLGTFWHGAKLDISTTGYFLLIPLLVIIPGVYFNGIWYRIFIRWYSYI